jgi:WYL_2, Sm-like SH3 beta-barrel fold
MSKRDELKQTLQSNRVIVAFTKADGSERVMTCTLKPDLLPLKEAEKTRKAYNSEHTLRVWDLEKQAWRSFVVSSVKTSQILN